MSAGGGASLFLKLGAIGYLLAGLPGVAVLTAAIFARVHFTFLDGIMEPHPLSS